MSKQCVTKKIKNFVFSILLTKISYLVTFDHKVTLKNVILETCKAGSTAVSGSHAG